MLSRKFVARVSVWESSRASPADGLWGAAAAGRVDETAVIELKSKPAVWSSTTKSFELDMLEVRLLSQAF